MGEKIKILHFALRENIGGIETFLLNVYKKINREKFQFDFVTEFEEPAYEKQFLELGALIYKVSPEKKYYSYAREIEQIIKKNNYDIVHIHKNSAANIIPFLICKKYRIKVIAHSHNTAPTVGGISYLLHYLNRFWLYKFSDIHLACSQVAGKWLYGNKEFKVITNGIDVDNYLFNEKIRSAYRKKLDIHDDDFVIICVGRFSQQKNHERLIEIFNEIVYIYPNSKLILVGNGLMKSKIKDQVKLKDLEEQVVFLENRNDINCILTASDCFIMTSLFEGLPIAAIEAQAAGLPVFLTDTISRETDILGTVEWYSLDNSNKDISNRVLKCCSEKINRISVNRRIVSTTFEIRVGANSLDEIYTKLAKPTI